MCLRLIGYKEKNMADEDQKTLGITDETVGHEDTSDPSYFLELEGDELLNRLNEMVDCYREDLTNSGLSILWQSLHQCYNSGYYNNFGKSGADRVIVNNFRNILANIMNTVVKQPPTLKATSTTSLNADSQGVVAADSILEYWQENSNIDAMVTEAVEYGLLYGLSYVLVSWDRFAGDLIENGGDHAWEGNLRFKTFNPLEVAYDTSARNLDEVNWYITRERVNYYELEKKVKYDYGDDFELIRPPAMFGGDDVSDEISYDFDAYDFENSFYDKSDYIDVYTLWHKEGILSKNGRVITFTRKQLLRDDVMRTKVFPLYRFQPDRQAGSTFPYAVSFDLLPIQKTINIIYKTKLENFLRYGISLLVVPRGSALQNLDNHMTLYTDEGGGKDIKVMNLHEGMPDFEGLLSSYEQAQTNVSGIGDQRRGNLKAQTPAKALNTIANYTADLYNSVSKELEECYKVVCKALLSTLRHNLATDKQLDLVEADGMPVGKSIKARDILPSYKITVELVNPLANTIEGKLSIANLLIGAGVNLDSDAVLKVMQDGTLPAGYYDNIVIDDQVRRENTKMLMGFPVDALMSDEHWVHIRQHKKLLMKEEVRKNKMLVDIITGHIKEHNGFVENVVKSTLFSSLQLDIPPESKAIMGLQAEQEQQQAQQPGSVSSAAEEEAIGG